jgi:hypothetical protein
MSKNIRNPFSRYVDVMAQAIAFYESTGELTGIPLIDRDLSKIIGLPYQMPQEVVSPYAKVGGTRLLDAGERAWMRWMAYWKALPGAIEELERSNATAIIKYDDAA